MVRNHRRQGFGVLLLLLLASILVSTPAWSQAATSKRPTHTSKPHQVFAQSGAGSANTRNFRITQDPWQIHWSYSCPSGDTTASDNGLIVRIVRNGTQDGGAAIYETTSSGSGVTSPMTGKGKYALDVLTDCPWTLTADQNSGRLPPKPANSVFMEMGFGAANTPTFRVTKGPWLIKWSFACSSDLPSGDDGIHVTVMRNGQLDEAPEVSISTAASGVGQTSPMLGIGRFSFNVLTYCPWTLYAVQHANGQQAFQQLGSAVAAGHTPTTTTTTTTKPKSLTAPNNTATPSTSAASQPSSVSCVGQMDCCPAQNPACTPPVIAYNVGQSGTLWDGGRVQLATITVSAPTFSTTDVNGDIPQFGEFATFTVTVADIAPASEQNETIDATDTDFYVQLPNGQRYGLGIQTGVQEGNSSEAAGPNELGTNSVGGLITLSPGQSTTGTATIDMPGTSGQIFYSGGGQIDGSWSF